MCSTSAGWGLVEPILLETLVKYPLQFTVSTGSISPNESELPLSWPARFFELAWGSCCNGYLLAGTVDLSGADQVPF